MQHSKARVCGLRHVMASFVLALAVATPAIAQDDTKGIDEIIVTATKREQSIQDVPIALSAFTGADLIARGVSDLKDLQQISPSIAVYDSNSTAGGGTLRIRGVGTTGNNAGLEAAVGSFIDGVYRSRAGLAITQDFLDLERIEVLRGPQGTLFGKNTTAGAVNIITKKPSFDLGGSLRGTVGNDDEFGVQATLTGPLVDDTLAFRLSGSWRERDGYYDEIGGNREFSDIDRWGLRGQLLWTPSEDLEARMIFDYREADESCCPAAYHESGPLSAILAALGGDISDSSGDKRVGVNHEPSEEIEDWGVSIEVNWDLEWATLTSLTAYREFESSGVGQDIDFSNVDILIPQNGGGTTDNFSQELRLAGTWEDDLDWLAGIYFYTEDIHVFGDVKHGTQAAAYYTIGSIDPLTGIPTETYPGVVRGSGDASDFKQDTIGVAFFTHNTYHVTEKFSVTAGARWSWQEKEADSIINGAPPGTFINDPMCSSAGVFPPVGLGAFPFLVMCNNVSYTDKKIEREFTGTLSVSYAVTEDTNVYLGATRGYKAGGFNLDHTSIKATGGDGSNFDPEFANAFEFGVKSTELMDGRMTLNAALFHTTFKGYQLNTFTGTTFFISNLPRVKARGVELEGFALLAEGVILTAGVTYADTRYGDHLFSPPNVALEGRRITQAPAWQASAAVSIDRPLGDTGWNYVASSNYGFRGHHNTGSDLQRVKIQTGYSLWNAQAGVVSQDGSWEIMLWGRNLTDRHYNSIVFNSVFQSGSFNTFFNRDRAYGVTVQYNFGESS